MNRHGIGRVLLLAAVIGTLATACGSPDHKSPAAKATSAATKPSRQAQQLYLKMTRALYPGIANRSDADLLALGDEACTGFRGGDDYDTVVAGLQEHALTEWDAMGVVTSVSTPDQGLCPEAHKAVMDNLMEHRKS
ncbi:DUF732 domain-containing protein [Streptomyces sp. NBC_01476]|uniref:DUF732 domain-containing protein n=1 Tax=Streptomyces sp. NBC_01476 TaxID=2903881 RepID=UPI002E2F3FE8|nr:DUF732 domain-containing protein [Streptomyces sp. NBC_01476]